MPRYEPWDAEQAARIISENKRREGPTLPILHALQETFGHVPEAAVRMVAETGCDAVMIGRAASSNPWIFRQIAQYLDTGRYDHPTDQDRHEIMRTYFSMLIENGERDMLGKMKQFATYFTHGVRNGAKLRGEIYRLQEAPKILDTVDEFFNRQLETALAG